MTINGLWPLLGEAGTREVLGGQILQAHVEGKSLAIDASFMVIQALKQKEFVHDKFHLRLTYERLSHYLRMGVLPVVVIEGRAPSAKGEALYRRATPSCPAALRRPWQRQRQHEESEWTSEKYENFLRMGHEIKELCHIMHVPCVEAPGEAEAMCASLERQGKVDGVVTDDGDALLYGARKVYKGLHLHTSLKQDSHKAEWVDMDVVERKLGLSSSDDFLALCLLSGGDFLPDGVKGMGTKGALKVLQVLQRKRAATTASSPSPSSSSSSSATASPQKLLDLLYEALNQTVDETLVAPGAGLCSTCKNCRHGGTRKAQHGVHGCEECGTHPKSRGGTGKGGCIAAAPSSKKSEQNTVSVALAAEKEEEVDEGEMDGKEEDSSDEDEDKDDAIYSCPCGPCQRRDERILHLMAKKARETDDYIRKFSDARRDYEAAAASASQSGVEEGAGGSQQGKFAWHPRPDYSRLRAFLRPVFGSACKKILPLLLEYDARSCGPVLGQDIYTREITAEDVSYAGTDYGYLFVPVRIERVSQIGSTGSDNAWRYQMEFRATGEQGLAILRECMTNPPETGAPLPSIKEVLDPEKVCLRQSLVKKQFQGLVAAFEEVQEKKKNLATPAKAKKKKQTPAGRALASLGSGGSPIDVYFSPVSSQQASQGTSPTHLSPARRRNDHADTHSPTRRQWPAVEPSATAALMHSPHSPPKAALVAATRSQRTPPPAPTKKKRRGGRSLFLTEGGNSPRRNLDDFFKRHTTGEMEEEGREGGRNLHGSFEEGSNDLEEEEVEEGEGQFEASQESMIDLTDDTNLYNRLMRETAAAAAAQKDAEEEERERRMSSEASTVARRSTRGDNSPILIDLVSDSP